MASIRPTFGALGVALLLVACASPFDVPPSPTVSPAATPAATATPGPSPAATAPPTASPAATSTLSAEETWAAMHAWTCFRVVHTSLGDFASYLDAAIGFYDDIAEDPGDLIEFIQVKVLGANDDDLWILHQDDVLSLFDDAAGLRGAGPKTIVSVEVFWRDGTVTDVTESVIEDLGSDTIEVRFPEEDEFGDCSNVPES